MTLLQLDVWMIWSVSQHKLCDVQILEELRQEVVADNKES